MFYDLTNPELRATLEDKVRRWLIEAESKHKEMYAEWNDADNYFENLQVPDGFTEAHKDQLANVNDPTQGSVTAKQYVVFNKILMTHEGILGDFINGKKMISVTGRSPKDKKFARVIKSEMEMLQDQLQLWDEIVVPTIDSGIRRGIHWIKIWFDATQNLPFGKINVREISCRDVLVDPKSRGTFYQDKQYIIHRQRFLTDDANLRFRRYTDGVSFSPDRLSDDAYLYQASPSRDLTSTVYEFQYKELEIRYFAYMPPPEPAGQPSPEQPGQPGQPNPPQPGANPQADAQIQEITEEQYAQLSQDPQTASKCFMESKDVWYTCLYNRGTGVFYNAASEFEMDTLIPFINIRSEGRLYPLGSTKYDKNLQDLLNVFISVLLDNAKRGNRGIYGVNTQAYQQYSDQIIAAVNGSGPNVIPTDEYKVEYPRELNPGIVQLFSMVEKALDDVQSQHGLSKGEMPRERLAEKTVNLLIQQDRTSHGRKDIMIRWTLTKLGKLMFKIITSKFTESHWAITTDANAGDTNYTPINQIVNDVEYLHLLASMVGIELTPDMDEQQLMQADQQIQAYRKTFEKENEVVKRPVAVYTIEGKQFTQEQYDEFVKQSGMAPEEFQQKYRVQQSQANVYVINDINKDVDVDVIYEVDFNYERDREMKVNRAFMLYDRHIITGDRVLGDLDYPDADEAWGEAVKQNQALQLGNEIVANPQLYQMVMSAMQALQNQAAAPSGGQNGSAPKTPATKGQSA
jgi:hypothetical protein